MTGSSKRIRPPAELSPAPAPAPMAIPGREEEEAKRKARRMTKRRGRESTILAGRMMKEQSGYLKNILGG